MAGSIKLRKIEVEQDAENFYHYMNHPKVAAYLAEDDIPNSFDAAKKDLNYWSQLFHFNHGFYWAISEKDNSKIIGTCGFNIWNKQQKRAEISYDIDFNYWNKGYATNAVSAICEFALQKMEVVRIQATVETTNKPSSRVLEKCGFTNEGVLRKYGVLNNISRDFYMYSLCN